MYKLAIMGCGKLAKIIAQAFIQGMLPEYELIAVYSRTVAHAQEITDMMQGHQDGTCQVCQNMEELLALKPDFLVEAASPAAMKEWAVPALQQGCSVVTLSIGALADKVFYEKALAAARENGSKIYLVSGATGGFDVLRTATLMGNAKACFFNEKGPNALKNTPVYDDSMQTEQRVVFSGCATQAIEQFPTKVNVTVAASLASVGPEQMQVRMQSTPGFVGDTQRVEIKNDQVHAVIDVYSATAEIAAWSVVSKLQNIVSAIVF
ncbi:MAG: DUF108 domain-containing protein [Bacteroidales bacterium]|nr:DUF108 domain-containing protein [Bacteroidales bacterium]